MVETGDVLYNKYVGKCWVWSYDPTTNLVVVGYEGWHCASQEWRVFFRGDPYTDAYFEVLP